MNNIPELFSSKYNPKKLSDFFISDDLLNILEKFVSSGNIHLFFVGGSGSGKTSMLKVIVDEYYKGYSHKQYEDDVLKITSLKEQGINYYRTDVKMFCQTAPTIRGKRKIIILDDIDFMNDQNQQIFRNCVEKYTNNVNFILTCTNIQKVIDGIQSRFPICKLFLPKENDLNKMVHKIKHTEKITMTDDAVKFIIKISNNNVNTVVNYMNKFKLYGGTIDLSDAVNMCTNINFGLFEDFLKFMRDDKLSESIQVLFDIFERGYSVMDILDGFFIFIKMTDKVSEDEKYLIVPIICEYIAIFHNFHEDEIELTLFTNNLYSVLRE